MCCRANQDSERACYRLGMNRLAEALRRIDAANAADPNRVDAADGPIAKELLYSRRMTSRLARLAPEASEELQLACRAQHICRWKSPRSDYPEGRAGYKAWRSNLLTHHAEEAGAILREVGYSQDQIERVQFLIKKQHRTSDPESQTLEDVACLVFLEHELEAFASKHDDDKLVDIVRKTWKKMSEDGHRAALTLELSERCRAIVERAIG